MSELYLLENPRGRKHRRYNPEDTGLMANPFDTAEFIKNPHRKHRKRNPLVSRVSRRVEGEFFQGTDLADIGVAMVGLVGTQKLVEPIVKLVSPTVSAANGAAVESTNVWWVEPLASVLAAAAAGYAGAIAINRRVGKYLALGGGITAGLNIMKRIPLFQGIVAPGSIIIGKHRPALPAYSAHRPMALPAAIPSARVGGMDTARVRAQTGNFTGKFKM